MSQTNNHVFGGDNRLFLVALSFLILAPLSIFETMKHISYISLTAIVSIGVALAYVLITDVQEIYQPAENFDKTINWVNFSQIPSFFGIAMFMYEGNAVSLEIYQQMENGHKNFTTALGYALMFTSTLIILIGCLSYAAYAQFTQSIVLLNLTPSKVTFLIQIFYSVGILCSYCL